MTDACNAPNACQSDSLPVAGGTFTYDCPYLPPSSRFGLTAYDLGLVGILPIGGNLAYTINNEDGKILTIIVSSRRPYKFIEIQGKVLGGYTAAIVQNDDVLTIAKGDLRWVIGTRFDPSLHFTSCLISEGYEICNSPDRQPISQGPASAIPISFTFPCPTLPDSASFGFSTYELRLIYQGDMKYDAYLNPNGTSGFLRIGSFTYNGESGQFSVVSTESNYILQVVDGDLVLYANNNISPIWILSVFNSTFTARINVPPNPCTQAVAVIPEVLKTLTFNDCPQLSAPPSDYGLNSYNVTARIMANSGESVRSRLSFDFNSGDAFVTSDYFNGTAPIVVSSPSPDIIIRNITNTSFNVEIINQNRPRLLVYTVQYKDGQLFVIASTGRNSLDDSFISPGPNVLPNIFARIEASPDGKQICVLNFTVTQETLTRTYRQYCVPFAAVICAPGSTLREKLNALQLGNDFVQYMVLRYILSALLCQKPFDKFDVNLLRQRYNQPFLRALAHSEYRVFLPILKANPSFATYFKC